MRAIFMNLILLAAFQLIFTIMISELNSDKILSEKYQQMLDSDHKWLEVINSEEELWNVAEIIGKNNLDEENNLGKWINSAPGSKELATLRCSLGDINTTQLAAIVGFNKESNSTIMGELRGYNCQNYTAGTTGILISSGPAKRWIWAAENRSWH